MAVKHCMVILAVVVITAILIGSTEGRTGRIPYWSNGCHLLYTNGRCPKHECVKRSLLGGLKLCCFPKTSLQCPKNRISTIEVSDDSENTDVIDDDENSDVTDDYADNDDNGDNDDSDDSEDYDDGDDSEGDDDSEDYDDDGVDSEDDDGSEDYDDDGNDSEDDDGSEDYDDSE